MFMKMWSRFTWMNAAASHRQCDTTMSGAVTDAPAATRMGVSNDRSRPETAAITT